MADDVRLLLACMPKSGSSFLSEIIGNMPNFRRGSFVPASGGREQELCIARIKKELAIRGSIIAQHHVRNNLMTRKYIDIFVIKPVVLVRNIFDVLVSFRDHMRGDPNIPPEEKRQELELPLVWRPADFGRWDDAKQLEFSVKMAAAWYLNFFVSWSHYPDKVLLTYEEITSDTKASLSKISDRYGFGWTGAAIDFAIGAPKGNTRFNVGVSGRGQFMTDTQIRHVKNLASFYQNVDFGPIGL